MLFVVVSFVAEAPTLGFGDVFNLLDFAISIVACYEFRVATASHRRARPALESLVACYILSFGGTTVTGVLLGQPPGWMVGNATFLSMLLAWTLVFHSPSDAAFRALRRVAPLRRAFELLGVVSSAHCNSTWGIEKVLSAEHVEARRSVVLAVACGVASTCGGGVIGLALGLMSDERGGWRLRTPPTLSSPSATVKTALLGTVLYYVATDPHGHVGALLRSGDSYTLSREHATFAAFALKLAVWAWDAVLGRGDPFAAILGALRSARAEGADSAAKTDGAVAPTRRRSRRNSRRHSRSE
jgi:hypothetical protein